MRSGRSRACSAIQDLFERPPLSDQDIADRLRDVDPHEARRALVARFQDTELSERNAETLMAMFAHLGVGDEKERVAAVVLDHRASNRIRAYACGLLASEDATAAELVMDRLAVDERQAIFDVPFVDMLVWAQADARAGEQLAVALDGIDDELGHATFARIEQHRQRVGTSTAAAYGATLRKGRAPGLQARMLDALVGESSHEGIELVQELRDGEQNASTRRALQAALLRMNTRAIEPTAAHAAPTGQGYLSSCDQHGDFVVLGCYENPDESTTVADICVRAGGELRGGFVLLRQSRDDIRNLLAELGAGTGGFAPISLAEVARIVDDARVRTHQMRRAISSDLQPALALVSRTTPSQPEEGFVTPSWDAPVDTVRALLASPGHDRAWLLSSSDLEIVLASPPPPQGASRTWIQQAARAIGKRSRRRTRLVDMAKHMARWHQAKGELEAASVCSTLAHLTEKQAATSPLLIALLERAFGRDAVSNEHSAPALGDHAIRNALRDGPFANVAVPKGKDLARLDFTETAYTTLRQGFVPISTLLPIDDDARVALAHDLAEAFVQESVGRKKAPNMTRIEQRMRTAIARHFEADDAQVEAMAAMVLSAFAAFWRDVCGRCPVRCIERARAHLGEAFFSQDHPAL